MAAPGPGERDQLLGDVLLGGRRPAAALAGMNALGARRREIEHSGVDEGVVHHNLGLGEHPHRFQGEQSRVAGTCTHEPHLARSQPRAGVEDRLERRAHRVAP